jgi:hypothetical protein
MFLLAYLTWSLVPLYNFGGEDYSNKGHHAEEIVLCSSSGEDSFSRKRISLDD